MPPEEQAPTAGGTAPGALPHRLTPSALAHLVRTAPGTRLLDDADRERVARGHRRLLEAARSGQVYGYTTGVGALRSQRSDGQAVDSGEHARRLWLSHAGGTGPELDDETARATMIVRLRQACRGGSGLSPALVEALAAAVQSGAVPRLRAWGSIGTGDLTVLAQLALTLVGEQPWRSGRLAPVRAESGDALPFISSNAATVATGSLAVARLTGLRTATERVTALSHRALRGSLQAYDARVHAAKDDTEAAATAAHLTRLLASPDTDVEPARIQDPFGLRTVPQVHAALGAACAQAAAVLTAEAEASAENPLVVDGGVLHHGQFLTQRLAGCLDAVRTATSAVLALSSARTSALLDPRQTDLPAFLADRAGSSSGLMIVEYLVADLLAQARTLSTSTVLGSAVISLGQEEHASFSSQGSRLTTQLADLVPAVVGAELATAVRALRLAGDRVRTGPAADLFAQADRALPDVREDHLVGPELDAAAEVVLRWARLS